MKYMLLVCADPTIEVGPDEVGDIDEWFAEIAKRGKRLDGERLQSPSSAKSVKIRGGSRLVTDGPFAETKEIIAGFDIIECDTLEDAVDIAGLHPVAKFGVVEVRPFYDWGSE
jgi:hypothetical protein